MPDELVAGSDIEDTMEPEEVSFRSTCSEAMRPQDEAVRSQDAVVNAISSSQQLPLRMRHLDDGTGEPGAACLDGSIRNIALQRLVHRENQLLRADPILKGLSPLKI